MKRKDAASGRKMNGVAGLKPATKGKERVNGGAKPVACADVVGLPPIGPKAGKVLVPVGNEDTEIAWTHRTINWWMGCEKKSEGCRQCYAEKQCKQYGRLVWGPNAPRQEVAGAPGEAQDCNEAAGKMGCKDTVFCCSLSDFFEDRPDLVEMRRKAWTVIKESENLVFIILTKRPENIAGMLPPDWGDEGYSNVCLAATVENGTRRVMDRIAVLRAVPARWRMLSAEPLLGPIDLRGRLDGIDWVIAGGESGETADPKVIRPMHPDWARSIRDACQEADVAFFFKQWGSWSMAKPALVENPTSVKWEGFTLYFTGMNRLNMAPAVLDGRAWREHPFGEEVDLERPSAFSRIQEERAAARSLEYQDPEDKAEFERLNHAVLKGFTAIFEAGSALLDIRNRKLWRAGGHSSWEAYCETLGGISRAYADRLIKAAVIHAELAETAPIGAVSQPVLPLNESQVRHLAKLPDAAARNEVWQRAVSQSNGSVPTARVVNAVVLDVLATVVDPPGPVPGERPTPPSGDGETADSRGRMLVVHTIGFTEKSAARLFALLRESGVRRVIDVRHDNTHQLAGFTKGDDLEFFLREILGVDYHWLPELAPTEEIRGMDDWSSHEEAFLALMASRDVENQIDPNLINGGCLLCTEHEPDRCHRRLVAEYLRDRWGGRDIELGIVHLN